MSHRLTSSTASRPDIAARCEPGRGRNPRNVWAIGTQPFRGAHFATFPERLVEPIIRVATPEVGVCPRCGAPWARLIETQTLRRPRPSDRTARHQAGAGVNSCGNTVAGVESRTLGWNPTCACRCTPVPATVLDPFAGSGTVGVVAARLNRTFVGIELAADYLRIAETRLAGDSRKCSSS